ncbi:MAG: xanthine dehydrogenase family protein molybdopterin-binding subunit [Candidatus Latescibacteria bacterium]|nr:xanthine dehydrogenase family protein molybdopterin-binding subunit [Candidatus Latescibacterota bacterium]
MPGWSTERKILGKRTPRLDGVAKVTGNATYTCDVRLPGMLYGKILRSPHPHAKIVRVDATRAEKLPEVKAVLTDLNRTVRFAGDEVAAIAAISDETAEDALRLINVTYEPLPFVVNEEEAKKPDAPQVFDGESNMKGPRVNSAGDIEQGFREADAIIEATYRTQVQTHACLETHGIVAQWEGEKLTVWASTQGIFSVRDQLANHFNIPATNIQVICDYMGGGFGSKLAMRNYDMVAARLAKETGAPVKLMLNREEDFLCTGNRPSSIQWIRIGAKKDGMLTAFDHTSYGTGGISGGAGVPAPYIYKVTNFRTTQSDVFTNAGPQAPMRAPGHPQASFAMESAMDELAEKLGIDPLEFRRRNDPNEIRQREYVIGSEKIVWSRRKKVAGEGAGPKKRGIGMGSCTWGGGGRGTKAQVTIEPDGGVEVRCGTQDIGTGTRTVIAVVAAEELGLRIEQITVRIGDTEFPPSGGSGGSTTAPSVAPAVKSTTEKAKESLFEVVAPALGAKVEDLVARDGRVFVRDNPDRGLTWKQATTKLGTEPIVANGEWVAGLSSSGVAGVQFAEVEVDVETGQVGVVKVVAVHDCGLIVDLLTAESQVYGGVIQGIGYALYENRIFDRQTGRMINADMENYKIPGAFEIPEIEVVMLDMPERGVIGLGEPPVIPTAAAVANAIANAIGARVYELPITPPKVLAALEKTKEVSR